jgi:hypothetical protein
MCVLLAGLAGCASAPTPIPPKARAETLNRLAADERNLPLSVYGYTRNCGVNAGFVSGQADRLYPAMCDTLWKSLSEAATGKAVVLEERDHDRLRFRAAAPATGGAAYSLVVTALPTVYPDGYPTTFTTLYFPERRIAGTFAVNARLYRGADGTLVREIEYNGRVIGYANPQPAYEAVAKRIAEAVAADFLGGLLSAPTDSPAPHPARTSRSPA